MTEKPWYEDIVMPALLRHARGAYGGAMRRALDAAGFEDVPANGLYVIGGLAMGAGGAPLGALVRELRISKQAAGQLVDTLVMRGYLERAMDPDDRRKLTVTLTERGKAAAAVQAEARQRIDSELLDRVGADAVNAARRTVATLCEIAREQREESGAAA